MSRTITIKGIGRASAKPDTVVISMSLDSRAMDYDKAMEIATDNTFEKSIEINELIYK